METLLAKPLPPSMSREQMLGRIKDILVELRRRRASQPIEFYRPLQKAKLFHDSTAPVRAFIAANRAGKSEAHVVEAALSSLGINKTFPRMRCPNIGWTVSVTNEAQRDILQPKFLRYLAPTQIKRTIYRQRGVWDQLHLTNGSIIGFKSVEMGRQALQGAALDWASFDEEPPKDIYDEIKTRLVDYQGPCWLTFTPVNGMSWSYDEFVDDQTKDKSCEVFTASMWDNARSVGGYLEDSEIKRFEESISDPIMRRIRVYGEYHNQVGRIYKSFDKKIHVLDRLSEEFWTEDGTLKAQYDVYLSIDTGRRFAAGLYLVDYFGNVFKFDEFYAEDQSIDRNARAVVNLCHTYGVWPGDITVDESSQFKADLAEHGLICNSSDRDVEKGINAAMEYYAFNPEKLKGPKYSNPRYYIVGPKCPRTLYEIVRYQWKPPAKTGAAIGEARNEPLKKDDHQMDVDRYVLVKRPDASKPPAGEDNRPIPMQMRDHVLARVKARAVTNGNDPTGIDNY